MLSVFLWLVSGLPATTYGYSEKDYHCGDVEKPVACSKGAKTASGVEFDPSLPQAAIAIPKKYRLRAQWICLRTQEGKKAQVQVVDKMNPRYVGRRGFDLTPKALELLGIKPTRFWSDVLFVC